MRLSGKEIFVRATLVLSIMTLFACDEDTMGTEPSASDFNRYQKMLPTCVNIVDESWCQSDPVTYTFSKPQGVLKVSSKPTNLLTTQSVSSSSTSSSSTSSSSGSSTGGSSNLSYTMPASQLAHAPSLEWVEYAGWQFSPGSYSPAVDQQALILNKVHPPQTLAATMQSIPLGIWERGIQYEVSVSVMLEDSSSPADISLSLSDNIMVSVAQGVIKTKDVTYQLATRNNVTSGTWVNMVGIFEYWGSSGLHLAIESDGAPLVYQDLVITSSLGGELTGNPVLEAPQSGSSSAWSMGSYTWYIDQGWVDAEGVYYPEPIIDYSLQIDEVYLGDDVSAYTNALLWAVYQGKSQSYEITVEVKSDDLSMVDVDLVLVDGVRALMPDGRTGLVSLSNTVSSESTSGEWVTLRGSYIYRGSSGFRVQLKSDMGAFNFRNLLIQEYSPAP